MGERDHPASDVLAAAAFLKRRALWIAVPAATALTLAVMAVLLAKPVYRATVRAIPAATDALDSSVNDVVGRLGGVATLFSAGAGISGNSTQVAVELLKSKSLARKFIEARELAGVLLECAPASAASSDNRDCEPMLNDAVRKFVRKVRNVSFDRRTNIVTLDVDWTDPVVAAAWANAYVGFLNDQMRDKAMSDSRRNIGYLTRQLESTTAVEVKAALFRLMEVELKNSMLAEVREEYVLRVVDPAIVPDADDIEHPRAWLWISGGLSGGLILGFLLAMFAELRALARAAR